MIRLLNIIGKNPQNDEKTHQGWIVSILTVILLILLSIDVAQQFRFLSIAPTFFILFIYVLILYIYWNSRRKAFFRIHRRSLLPLLLILAVPFATKLNLEIHLLKAKGKWETFSKLSLYKDAQTIRNHFTNFLTSAEQLTHDVATDYSLRRALDDPNIENRAAIFQILSEADPEFKGDYGIEVFDMNNQSVAWAGVTFPPHEFFEQSPFPKESDVFVITGQLHTVLCVAKMIHDIDGERTLGTVFVYRPLSVNISIQTKSLRRSSFVEFISPRVRNPFHLDFISSRRDQSNSSICLPTRDEEFSVILSDFENNTLGVVRFTKPFYQGYMISQRNQTARISILFLSIAYFFLLVKLIRILYWRPLQENNLKQSFFRNDLTIFFEVTFLLWFVRYGLLFLGFPEKVVALSIFDPIHYASPFLYGLSRSIGDLFLTLVVLNVNIFLGWKLILRSGERDVKGKRIKILLILSPLLAALFIHFLFDAYISGIRSLVHDSTLSFFNYLDLFSSSSLAMTMTNLFLLSVAFLSFTLLVIYLVDRSLRSSITFGLTRWGWITFAYALIGTLWITTTNHVSYMTEKTALIFFLILLALWINRQMIATKVNRLAFILLLTMVSSIISFPIFNQEILKEEDHSIRFRTAESLEPTESWIRFMIESSLDYFDKSANIQKSLLERDLSSLNNLAFVEWAKSPLNRLHFGSSVTILDEYGTSVSQFALDVPLGSEQTVSTEMEEIEEAGGKFLTVSQSRMSGKEVTFYTGAVPILVDEKLIGAVIATVPVVKSPFGTLSRMRGVYPTLLHPVIPGHEFIHKYGPIELVVSTYERETLVESTNPTFLKGHRPPDWILDAIFDQKMSYIRADEKMGGKRFVNFYFPHTSSNKIVGMVSVGYEKPGALTNLYNFLRLLFTNLLLILGMYLLYRITEATMKDEVNRIVSIKRFQNKLLFSYAMLIIFPMLFMAYFGRNMTLSQQEDLTQTRIEEDLTLARTIVEEETINTAREIASNTEIRMFMKQPGQKELDAKKYGDATVIILNSDGNELWSTGFGRTDYEIRERARLTFTPRLFYSQSPHLAIGAIIPVFGNEEDSKCIGFIEYLRPIDNTLCYNLSQRIGRDVNVYHKGIEIASTRPELFQSEFLSAKLSSDAFLNIELLGKKFFYAKRIMEEHPFLEGYQPLLDGFGRAVGVLSIPTVYQQQKLEQETAKTISIILVVYGLVLSVMLFIGLLLSRRISSPVRELTEGTKRIATGDLNFRIETKEKDELGDLVASFNKMTGDLKSSQEKLIQAEKDAAWREMARQVAHEVKNPLTPMKLSIQHLVQAHKDKAKDFDTILSETCKMVSDQIDALRNIASEFSSFARLPKKEVQACNMNEIMQASLRLFSDSLKGIHLFTEYSDVMPSIEVDPEEMQRVFINLIQNSLQAMPNGGTLHIQTECQTIEREEETQTQIAIRIIDTGCGIPEKQKDKLFEPSFSTKTNGTGLGLAICKKVVDDLGGEILIDSMVGQGTTVTIILPVGLQTK